MLNTLLYKLKHFDYHKWSKLLFYTAFVQAMVQIIGLITGVLIIRMLPMHEYAFYTIANAMLGTMTLLSDGGVSTGVMAIGGEVWQDKKKLGSVLATGMALRQKFAWLSLLICSPILMYLLLKNGATWYTALFIALALIPAFIASLSDTMLQIVPKLHQDIKPLQQNQLLVSVIRLFLSSVALFVFPFTAVSLLANGLPRIYGNIQLKLIASKNTDPSTLPDVAYRIKILKVVKRILPGAIYYCFSGQITIWLLSIFGNTTSLAQVGALGRITMVFGLISTILSTIVLQKQYQNQKLNN